ncbi:MAG: 3-deoxy-D-manno-octulosonic acid transferase, partial [Chitinophagaceae bacterium]
INPALVLWVKYEYWFFYLKTLHKKNIPVLLVSGIFRSSQPFFKNYGGLWKTILKSFNRLFVQDAYSLNLLKENDLHQNAVVSGDTRFDRVTAIASEFEEIELVKKFCGNHRVVVAGSTWEEDDAEWVHYTRSHPEVRFIFAPHEVDAANIRYVQKMFPPSTLFSKLADTSAPEHILIIDNIGTLSKLYKYADVAYVGGGFRESGIHNILEAAVYDKPVIFGPVYEKFREARDLVERGGAFSIKNALELEKLLDDLFEEETFLRRAGSLAGSYVQENRGATEMIMNYIQEKRLLTN